MPIDKRVLDELFSQALEYPPAGSGLPGGGGIYLLTDEQDRAIQLAAAADLRRALAGRLQAVPGAPPGPPGGGQSETAAVGAEPSLRARRRPDLAAIVRRIRWQPAYSAFELSYTYYRVARVLFPSDYLSQVAFGPAWFVHVDPAGPIPRLTVGKLLRSPPGVDLGPLATQADAARLIEVLQDAFDLCRYEHILDQAPRGQACAYFEMGRCPAPCNGSIPMAQYREMMAAAVRFATGERAPLLVQLQSEMRAAAAGRAYERAGMLRQRLERARGIQHECFRWLRPVEEFNYLVVQRGGGRTRVKPFFVREGIISPGEVVPLKSVAPAAREWIARVRTPADAQGITGDREAASVLRGEQIALVSHFLFKADRPGLFLHAGELNDVEALAAAIRARFAKPPTPEPAGPPAAEQGG